MELADVTDSKSVGLITRAGSTPAAGTISGRRPGGQGDVRKTPDFRGFSLFFAKGFRLMGKLLLRRIFGPERAEKRQFGR